MENLAGDLLLGLKFVKLSILPTLFIHFVQGRLRELRSGYFTHHSEMNILLWWYLYASMQHPSFSETSARSFAVLHTHRSTVHSLETFLIYSNLYSLIISLMINITIFKQSTNDIREEESDLL